MEKKTKRAVVLFIMVLVIVALVLLFGRNCLFPGKNEVVNKNVLKEEKKPLAIGKAPPPLVEEKPSEKSAALRQPLKVKKSEYEKLREDVMIFFDYLDHQDYVRSYKIKGGTYEHSKKLISKLSASPPVVSGETKDLFSILRNMAHFYRTLGRKNVSLIKNVLSNEKEITEPSMDMLFQWIIMEMERKNSEIKVSLENLYEYAGFFLNTLAGKAYLARRDSKTRILVTYYSILVLDMANKKKLNRHGIDMLTPLNLALDDISKYSDLEDKKKYLKKLREIKKGLRNRA